MTEGIPRDVATTLGVPHYLLAQAARSAARCLLSRDGKQRFSHLLRATQACGEVAAAFGRTANGQK